ncbi:MAG: hypothetical protein Kow00106_15910 [Anaerolineae bacterium]
MVRWLWGVVVALCLWSGSPAEAYWADVAPTPGWEARPCETYGRQQCPPVRDDPLRPPVSVGYTGLANPARGRSLLAPGDDPLATFQRRPFDDYTIPQGGAFLDDDHTDPHYGVDYACPADYLKGQITYFYPIAPGFVTARSSCTWCYVDGDAQGRVVWKWPRYNFGWGGLILVETPINPNVSVYVLYAHVARDFVSLGDFVTPDEVIGVVGTSGYSEQYHLHVEIRYGPPGMFWNADFSQWATHDRWMATMFTNPAYVVYPENHGLLLAALQAWGPLRPEPQPIP